MLWRMIIAFIFCVAFASMSMAQNPPVSVTPSAQNSVQSDATPPTTSASPTVSLLHPAFKFEGQDFQRWVKRGTDAAKKGKKDNILEKSRKSLNWVRGKKGKVDGSVWLREWDGTVVAESVFDAINTYEPVVYSPELSQKGGFLTQLRFKINLQSQPQTDFVGGKMFALLNGLNGNNTATKVVKEATEKEVKVLKIVITDNFGNVYPVADHSVPSPVKEKDILVRGLDVYRSQDSAYIHTDYGSANGYYSSESLIPYSSEHKLYEAAYEVGFNLFDVNGKPLIPAKVSEITLRIITEAGEMSAVYELSKFNSHK